MSITTVSQSQLGQDTAKNSQVVTTVVKNFTSGTLGSGPSITSVVVTDSSYNTLDDTAVTTSNGYIKIIGTGFTSAANVYIGSSAVPAANVTFVSSTEIRARVPVLSVGNYSLSLFNSNSSGTISSSTFIVSTGPVWVTSSPLSTKANNIPFSINFSATSDTTITYSNTSVLPTGTTLLSNGYFYGTVTVGSSTNYNFDVKATDTENQDDTKTFNLTVTTNISAGLYVVGFGANGQTGKNDIITRSSPVQVGSSTDWSKLTGSQTNAVLAIKTDGTIWSWGTNNHGPLGQNDRVERSNPTQIGAATWSDISSNGSHVVAVKTNGTLWTWGFNGTGQLGSNNKINRSSPVQVGALTNWSKVFAGQSVIISTKTDGTLWGIGRSFANGSTTYRSSPVQIGAATDWTNSKIAVGYTVHAIKTNGTMWMWGFNSGDAGNGLPNGGGGVSEIPIQLGSDTNWSFIQNVDVNQSKMAIKTDGTLWSWGWNGNFEIAQPVAQYYDSPVQVGSESNWSQAAASGAGIKTDGTLWAWGNNYYGSIGNNSTVAASSPIQVGASANYSKIFVSYGGLFATAT